MRTDVVTNSAHSSCRRGLAPCGHLGVGRGRRGGGIAGAEVGGRLRRHGGRVAGTGPEVQALRDEVEVGELGRRLVGGDQPPLRHDVARAIHHEARLVVGGVPDLETLHPDRAGLGAVADEERRAPIGADQVG